MHAGGDPVFIALVVGSDLQEVDRLIDDIRKEANRTQVEHLCTTGDVNGIEPVTIRGNKA